MSMYQKIIKEALPTANARNVEGVMRHSTPCLDGLSQPEIVSKAWQAWRAMQKMDDEDIEALVETSGVM